MKTISQLIPEAILKANLEIGEWRKDQFPEEYVDSIKRMATDIKKGQARVAANLHYTLS